MAQLGRAHELLDRARHPNAGDRIPVLYITVPPAATARMVAAEFARFLGLPVRPRSNMTDIIEAVVGICTDTRTGLVLVDEIHNISQRPQAGAEVSDTLKYFSERIPATFVYAGIDLQTSELLVGTRGAQIAGRFTLVPTGPFPYGDEWKGLIVTMEETLILHDHPPRSLVKLDRYLHNRTDGMIGALSHAIRGAAIDAILNGTERVTKEGLDAIPPGPCSGVRPSHPEARQAAMTDIPPPRLPIYVRPADDDTVDSYIQRLAHANHLPPADLRSHLCAVGSAGPPLVEKPAAVTGRPLTDLQRALIDTRCGNCFQPLHSRRVKGRPARWCSDRCPLTARRKRVPLSRQGARRPTAHRAPCARCGTVVERNRPFRWCSEPCRQASYEARWATDSTDTAGRICSRRQAPRAEVGASRCGVPVFAAPRPTANASEPYPGTPRPRHRPRRLARRADHRPQHPSRLRPQGPSDPMGGAAFLHPQVRRLLPKPEDLRRVLPSRNDPATAPTR
nr:TniB family NTP-binding protein [Streptomyces sp. JHA26]